MEISAEAAECDDIFDLTEGSGTFVVLPRLGLGEGYVVFSDGSYVRGWMPRG